jgi:ABC-2 type transport system ATP-binding protein
MIEIKNLHKSFKNFEALKGINLTVSPGEIYGFLGHNGAGKSTTMNILAGLSYPTSGSVKVGGVELTSGVRLGALDLGYLPEDPRFYSWMSAKEALSFYLDKDRFAGPDAPRRIDEILSWIGLAPDANRRIGGYSRGMKQRLGLGIALINDPTLLLLDEPSSALDPQGRKDVLQLILDLKQLGKTIFLSTHILGDAEKICDRVSILSQGQIVLEESISSLRQNSLLPQMLLSFSEELDPGTLERVQTDLTRLEGIANVSQKEDSLLIKLSEELSGKKALFSYLGASELPVNTVSQQVASLEDIFLMEVSRHA